MNISIRYNFGMSIVLFFLYSHLPKFRIIKLTDHWTRINVLSWVIEIRYSRNRYIVSSDTVLALYVVWAVCTAWMTLK